MRFSQFKTFESGDGRVSIHPDAVVYIVKQEGGSTVHLTNRTTVTISEDAKAVATKLWAFVSETDNGFFNERHILAILPQGEGCRLIFTGNTQFDSPAPVEMMLMLLARGEQLRADVQQGASR